MAPGKLDDSARILGIDHGCLNVLQTCRVLGARSASCRVHPISVRTLGREDRRGWVVGIRTPVAQSVRVEAASWSKRERQS